MNVPEGTSQNSFLPAEYRMESFETIHEMRKTLVNMNSQLTPYSSKAEHQRYLDSVCHYKKIMNNYLFRQNAELDMIINKSNDILRNFTVCDNIATIKEKIINGGC